MTTNWINAIGESAVRITGSEILQDTTVGWQAHARRTSLVAAVHGPYDSGKSTLIKRMLVEDGTAVPEWLTISGRRETVSVSAAESRHITYIDTPGTVSGNAEHDELAHAAVQVADVVILVITPQLLGDDAMWIKSFTTGTFYSPFPLSLFPDGSLLLVIAQSDTAGVDPVDSPSGFRELCERKREELAQMLSPGPGDSPLKVHIVSADPYGQVAADPSPEPGDYVAAGDWDGLADLRSDLAAAHQQLDALRSAGEIRYWCLAARKAADAARDEIEELESKLAEARSRRISRSQLEARLNAIDEAAIAELRSGLNEQLRGLPAMTGLDDASLRAEAQRRLQDVLDPWYAARTRQMRELTEEIAYELNIEQTRPASQAFDIWLSDLAAISARGHQGAGGHSAPDAFGKLGQHMSTAVKAGFWKKFGMTVERATDNLKKVHEADPEKSVELGKRLFGKHSVESVESWLPRVEWGSAIGEAVADVVPIAIDAVRNRQDRMQEGRQRQEIQERIAQVTSEMEVRILGGPDQGWRSAVAEMREKIKLDSRTSEFEDAAVQRIAELQSARHELLELLRKAPLGLK